MRLKPFGEQIGDLKRQPDQDMGQIRGHDLESALSVKNLALLGKLLATAALKREESRGAHFRLDFPETDDNNWQAVTRLEPGTDGGIQFNTDMVKG